MSSEAWIGIAGTAVGAATTLLGVVVQRRFAREDRVRDEVVRGVQAVGAVVADVFAWCNRIGADRDGRSLDAVLHQLAAVRLTALMGDHHTAARTIAGDLYEAVHAASRAHDRDAAARTLLEQASGFERELNELATLDHSTSPG